MKNVKLRTMLFAVVLGVVVPVRSQVGCFYILGRTDVILLHKLLGSSSGETTVSFYIVIFGVACL